MTTIEPHRPRTVVRLGAVAAGGALGTAARFAVATLAAGGPAAFPWATLLVNLAGSFALGALAGRIDDEAQPWLRPFLATGVLGAFTTYSTFAVETNQLLVLRPVIAALYLTVSLTGCLAAAAVGLRIGRR